MNCQKAQEYYFAYLQGAAAVPDTVSEHIAGCAPCLSEVERLRRVLEAAPSPSASIMPPLLQVQYQLADRWICCEDVKPLLPLLLVEDFSANTLTPVTAHLQHCPQCHQNLEALAAMKLTASQLTTISRCLAEDKDFSRLDPASWRVVQDIKQRGHRDILTRFSFTASDDDAAEETWLSDAYTVEVKHQRAETPVAVGAVRRRLAVPAFVTTGIAAAVLLLVLLTLPPAEVKALDLEQVYQGLQTIQNVHIRVFSEGNEEIRTIWIAEKLRARMFSQENEMIFWDERSGEIYSRQGDLVQMVSQVPGTSLQRPWGLLPFSHIAELPTDRQWRHIEDTHLNGLDVQVYELTWQQLRQHQPAIQKTWRGYLDVRTHLPYRIEWTEDVGDDLPAIQWHMEIQYPTDAECQDMFHEQGFRLTAYGAHTDLLVTLP